MLLLCYIKNVTLQSQGVQLSQLHQPSKPLGVYGIPAIPTPP